ncbi:unnamed protein product, partial [Rotaria sordida]
SIEQFSAKTNRTTFSIT